MDSVVKVAPYLLDPLILLGVVLLVAGLTVRQCLKAGIIQAFTTPPPFQALKFSHWFVLGLVLIGAGSYLKYVKLRTLASPAATIGQSENNSMLAELDYGFVELNPGHPTSIPSYKYGGNMVLYVGEEFRFQAVAEGEIPPIELRVGDSVQLLSGVNGKLKIIGPPNQPLSAILFSPGSRVSLPGGAPPRLSVKVQVFGAPRPK